MRPASTSTVETWGSTASERADAFGCDDLLPDAEATLFRAVDVRAQPAVVFRWLCQLNVAPYSYDWLDNWGRRSPRTLTPGADDLELGQRIMTIFRLAAFEPERSITAETSHRLFGRVAATYRVLPAGPDRSRLVVKLLVRYPAGATGLVMRRLLPAGDLVMMRKQLLTFKSLAERGDQPG